MQIVSRLIFAASVFSVATGCASYTGSAVDVSLNQVKADDGWIMVPGVEVVKQKDRRDCGAAVLTSVLRYYGQAVDRDQIAREYLKEDGDRRIRAGDLRDFAKEQGLHAFLIQGQLTDVQAQLEKQRPVIIGVIKPYSLERGVQHYEVVVGYHPQKKLFLTIDPAHGYRQNDERGFLAEWDAAKRLMLVAFPKDAVATTKTATSTAPTSAR